MQDGRSPICFNGRFGNLILASPIYLNIKFQDMGSLPSKDMARSIKISQLSIGKEKNVYLLCKKILSMYKNCDILMLFKYSAYRIGLIERVLMLPLSKV